MSDDEEIFPTFVLVQELEEIGEGGGGGECGREQDLRLVAGLGADERGGLEAALERARDDQVELDFQVIEDVRELERVTLTLFIQRSFEVEGGIDAASAGAGVAKDEQIHRTVIILAEFTGVAACGESKFRIDFAGQVLVNGVVSCWCWCGLPLVEAGLDRGGRVEDSGVGVGEGGGRRLGIGDGIVGRGDRAGGAGGEVGSGWGRDGRDGGWGGHGDLLG